MTRSTPLLLSCAGVSLLAIALSHSAGCAKKSGDGADEAPVPGQLLTVTSSGAASVQLSWAAATDDVTAAPALEYLAFLSTANDLNTVANVEANGEAVGDYAAGIVQKDVTGLAQDTTYWFSVLVRDEAGNKAAYTSVPAQTAAAGCAADLPPGGCPAAAIGKMTVCGRLADVETDAFVEATGAAGTPCPTTPTADGPCSLRIQFFDALDFAGNPAAATPIAPAAFYADDCGRYRAENLTPPSLGFLAVAVDDASGTSDRHRLTAVASVNPATLRALRTFVTRIGTDVAWSTGAGLAGPTFADRGVVTAIFRYQGAPRTGVQITRNGATAVGDDHYFSDAGPERSTVDGGLSVTGSNGTALFLGSSLVEHSGTGAEPPGCQWPSRLLASIAGVVFVQLMDAETNTGTICP